MNWREVDLRFRPHGLFVMGTLIDESSTIALIGAAPTMWQVFTRSMAYQDRQPDPLDRWSKQIITPIAQELGAKAHFPSDGPPYPPFIQWALASHRFWQSPVGMLVHDMAGLMISLRGALEVHTENQSAGIETPAP